MSDNQAVSWSQYSSHRNAIEYEVRHKISTELLEYIRFLEKNSASDCQTQGIESARLFVLHGLDFKNYSKGLDTQERLF